MHRSRFTGKTYEGLMSQQRMIQRGLQGMGAPIAEAGVGAVQAVQAVGGAVARGGLSGLASSALSGLGTIARIVGSPTGQIAIATGALGYGVFKDIYGHYQDSKTKGHYNQLSGGSNVLHGVTHNHPSMPSSAGGDSDETKEEDKQNQPMPPIQPNSHVDALLRRGKNLPKVYRTPHKRPYNYDVWEQVTDVAAGKALQT